MIIIFSHASDMSTAHVIEWLLYYDVPFIRINSEDLFEIQNFNLSSDNFSFLLYCRKRDLVVNFNEIKISWYRRGDIRFKSGNIGVSPFNFLEEFIQKEYLVLHDFIFNFIENLPSIDNFYRRSLNKINVLYLASKIGIPIPDTTIFEGNIPLKNNKIITKSLSESFHFLYGEKAYSTLTSEVISDNLNVYNRKYCISLIQEKIEKEADIRAFYLNGDIYSMAIMSQSNSKTLVDFRNYPSDNPNRRFTFKFPQSLKQKIDTLMKQIGINTGSLDFVLDKNGKLIFLEINPVGQFGMTSFPCNFHLEHKIALTLINLIKTHG